MLGTEPESVFYGFLCALETKLQKGVGEGWGGSVGPQDSGVSFFCSPGSRVSVTWRLRE